MRISDWSSDVCSSDLEIAAEMPLGKACTGSNRQPGRQIVGRAELIDVVIPPAESCLLAEGLDAAPIGPDEVEPDGQSRVRLDRDSRAKLFGCIYASARPGQKILVIAFEARHQIGRAHV